jgi:solute carrier family 25 aspartate/glutamate transporter 12/13
MLKKPLLDGQPCGLFEISVLRVSTKGPAPVSFVMVQTALPHCFYIRIVWVKITNINTVPFSAIYFPTYNHLKRDLFGESPTKRLGILQLLTAGAIAGMPAAYLTTPCDVVKTRLQVEARKGETKYTSLRHCAKTIWAEEGFKAFFKGGPARILRSSPQFGFTLAAYEFLMKLLPMPGSGEAEELKQAAKMYVRPGIGLTEEKAPLPYLRSRNALKIILDLDESFGTPKKGLKAGWASLPGVGAIGKGLPSIMGGLKDNGNGN